MKLQPLISTLELEKHSSKLHFPIEQLRSLSSKLHPLIRHGTALLSPKCQLCAANCTQNSALCIDCAAELPLMQQYCPVCALPICAPPAYTLPVIGGNLCGDCLKHPKPYQRTRCALLYENPVNYLMHAFKNNAQWDIGRLFYQLWLDQHTDAIKALNNGTLAQASIIPVPSHPKHSAKRGYIPTTVLAQHLSRATGIPIKHALIATREPEPQKSLCREQRLRNLTEVFQARHAITHPVILVDDVVTSCATAIAASAALKKAGANHIEIWAIARTPLI